MGFNKDMRATYSNALEEEQATAVRSHLINSMGFRHTANKETISLHVTDDKGASHVMSFWNARFNCLDYILLIPLHVLVLITRA